MGDACAQVSAGGEGYRADGPTNPPHNNWYTFSCCASLEIIICFACFMTAELQQSRPAAWQPLTGLAWCLRLSRRCFLCRINGGFKGLDPVGNIACPHIDFLTLHICEFFCLCFPQQECMSCHAMLLVHRLLAAAALCIHDLDSILVLASADPDNWAIQSWEFDWVNVNVIQDRAAIAHSQNKPFIIEETGMKVLACPAPLLQYIFAPCLSKCFPPPWDCTCR